MKGIVDTSTPEIPLSDDKITIINDLIDSNYKNENINMDELFGSLVNLAERIPGVEQKQEIYQILIQWLGKELEND